MKIVACQWSTKESKARKWSKDLQTVKAQNKLA
jgi:hypothetical protein